VTSASSPLTLPAPHLADILGDGQDAPTASLRHDGPAVSGCDTGRTRGSEKQGTLRDHLAQLGIPISTGQDPAHLPGEMTVLVYASLFGQVVAVAGTVRELATVPCRPTSPRRCRRLRCGIPMIRTA
jgi:hypothetical protein